VPAVVVPSERPLPGPYGRRHVASARRALNALDEVERTARRFVLAPELVLVATPTNSALLSPIVTLFVKHHADASLRLRRASDMDEVVRMVAVGETEVGFGDLAERADSPSLHAEAIWQADVVLVSPRGTKLPPIVPVARLAEADLVLPFEGNERRRKIDAAITAAGGRRPTPALATDEWSAWVTSAQQGIGSFLSYHAVAAELDGVELRHLDPPLRIPVGFVHRRGSLSNEVSPLLRLGAQCPVPTGCHPL
jgi:DNA-binding transcriptional LysR family regulator